MSMTYHKILVHIDPTAAGCARLELAIALAQRFKAQLTGLHVVSARDLPPLYKPSVAGRVAANNVKASHGAAAKAESMFRDRVKDIELPTDYRRAEGSIPEQLRHAALFADLLVVGQFNSENPYDRSPFSLPERVLHGCGTPVFVVPIDFPATEMIGKTILVDWDGSAVAARTIRDALPFLRRARSVKIMTVEAPGEHHSAGDVNSPAMVAHLARHGISVIAEQVSREKRHPGEILLSRAADMHADMIVMGAYTHMRLKELFLGGETRSVLRNMAIPALMSH
jgi:nucleotide-binding universal stress UspA family protein